MNCLPEALNILLIEPDEAEKKRFAALLKEGNLNACLSAVAAVQDNILPLENTEPPHIIFIDAAAADIDKAIAYIKTTFPFVPVIWLTEETPADIIQNDITDIIPKNELSAFALRKIIEYNCSMQQKADKFRKLVERLELLAQATNDIVWDWQLLKRSSVWIGNGLKTSLGYNESMIKVDTTFWERGLHPDDKDRVLNRLKSFFLDNQVNIWEDNYRFKTARGDYRYFHDRGYIIYENGIAVRLVGIMEDITEKLLLEEKLDEEQLLKQKEIAEAVVTAQEKERNEIGKELHDNVNQLLSASKLFIDAAAKDDGTRSESLLAQASGYITNAIEEIRSLSKVLHAPLIGELGLCESIMILREDIMMVNELNVEVDLEHFCEDDLNENFKITLYRIIQEQLTNILKHAKASNACILLKSDNKEIVLEVKDDGIGFDTSQKKAGIGLSHIQSRAGMYGGKLEIKSKPGKGSLFEIKFPISKATMLV
ncbi:MAG: PAS domain-containing protein [Ferruginibacter sp.]